MSRKSQSRVRLRNIDRLTFVWLYRRFPAILNAITVVKPETVIRWHRRGFRAYWRWKSRRCGGRPRIRREIRDLIRRMSAENPLWGAPRIHGELLMLRIEVAQSSGAAHDQAADRKTPPDDPGNPSVDFHGERRRNQTHQSTTDPAARLARKGAGKEGKLSYAGHVLMENRNGLAVQGCVTHATGRAEPQAAMAMVQKISGSLSEF